MSVQPFTPRQPHQAPRGPTGQLAGWAAVVLFLIPVFSGATIITAILLLFVLL